MDTLAPLSGKRILCIEDDVDTADLLSTLLRLSGYDVACAGTFADGVSLALSQYNGFALYLLDNWLPDGTGVDAGTLIRRSRLHTPIVFCSAAAFQIDRERALEAGAQAYLVKPFEPETLLQTIDLLIRGG